MEEKKQGHNLMVNEMYAEWFIDYASYVILERAVPHIHDGLKPVQRRILHAMYEMEDGRYNKVANIIGQTMQYHPHGDASINEAIVNMGQKGLLIDTQGNWGDFRTGDSAAAPRYIEARLSKFALEVLFSESATEWQSSYDGRKREPVTLPVKFPLLLAMGTEGIAVGLNTKILPHNFIELIQASIDILKNKPVKLYPDFPTGGLIDISHYNDGKRGGKVRVRAKMEVTENNKVILIKEIPYGTTTASLIESIVKANEAGHIKIKKVVDNTAKEVEIAVHLAPGTSPDVTIDALYAFTDCEISISPNACVILDEKPVFMGVTDILRYNTQRTLNIIEKELLYEKQKLEEKWHQSMLERIFIEEKIYRKIEQAETWEDTLATLETCLKPFESKLKKPISSADIAQLTEIKIKRISKYDLASLQKEMESIEKSIEEINYKLNHLTETTIEYFKNLLKKYGKNKERKTQIAVFENIEATQVAVANQKLYVNRSEGFVGYGMKKEEYVCDCSEFDDIIVFRKDGKCIVSKVSEKAFMGKDIIHVAVWKKGDNRTTYNIAYTDGSTGWTYVKRFQITAITRDKEYQIIKGNKNSVLQYFSANPNGEAEVIQVDLHPLCKAKNKSFEYDFSQLAIKGREAQGNLLTKYPVKQIVKKYEGRSTLGGIEVYYQPQIGRLNYQKQGIYLGTFQDGESIIVFYKNGTYEMTNFDVTNRYNPEQVLLIEKFNPLNIYSAIYYDGADKQYFVKRFEIETQTLNRIFHCIEEHAQSKLLYVSSQAQPIVKVTVSAFKGASKQEEILKLEDLVEVRNWKAVGQKLGYARIYSVE
ncbi:MAG: DNA gyrase/topoisomerase IV subunit A, partial [Bacteroidia bacterium]|nr:DNA gyrase/topoisomerase IV subunit A [Bacteroidia bacterium]